MTYLKHAVEPANQTEPADPRRDVGVRARAAYQLVKYQQRDGWSALDRYLLKKGACWFNSSSVGTGLTRFVAPRPALVSAGR